MKIKQVIFTLIFILSAFTSAPQNLPAEQPASSTVALFFSIGGRGGIGYNDSAYRGLEKAAAELGIKPVYIGLLKAGGRGCVVERQHIQQKLRAGGIHPEKPP